jgi:alcohol dehydrogenase class IV
MYGRCTSGYRKKGSDGRRCPKLAHTVFLPGLDSMKYIPMLADGVMKVTRLLANNPRTLTLEDAKRLYRAAM